jgi:hypothetical protein
MLPLGRSEHILLAMSTVAFNVSDFSPDERRVVESIVGRALRDDEAITVGVSATAQRRSDAASGRGKSSALPDYYHVYEGLSDDEIARIESVVLQRANMTRQV